jgi:single-stranded-DNA-specific exonuclease
MKELREEDLIPAIVVDAETSLSDWTLETVADVRSLEPFGSGNPDPVFYSGGMEVLDSRVVGERHLSMKVKQGTATLDAMGFNMADRRPLNKETINMIYAPEINAWNGNRKVRLRVIDFEVRGGITKLVRCETTN